MTCSKNGHDMNYDMVHKPKHYTQGKYESIDVILDVIQFLPPVEAALMFNVLKYLHRYHLKNGLEDIEKSRWYLRKLAKYVKEREKSEEKI